MTIKKRLFLSNILMIVIPACLGVLAVAAALLLFLTVLLPQSGSTWLSQHDMAETRSELVSLAEDWLSEADPAQQTALAARLEETAAAHQMVLVIRQDGGEAGRFGQGAATDQPGLTQALAALEGSGTVSDGTTDLFGAVYSAGGATYQLEVYSQGVVTDLPHQTEHLAATLLAAAVVMVLAAVLVTNRFLTRFVFRHIQEPLETLAEGVHQIRDGNLTHRIAYDSRDEFQPVCEDFNDMAQRLRASVEQSQREEASRKELLASISHDIRSPLTAIQAYVEGLLDGVADTPEKQREYLTILQAKATEMDQLVRKIFLFSKMDLGEYPYSPEPLDPAQEVAAVAVGLPGGLPPAGPVHHRGTPAHRLPGAGRPHLLPQHPHQTAGQQRQV